MNKTPTKVGSIRRGPWLAMPQLRGAETVYELTCQHLPGWSFDVPPGEVSDALYLLATQYPTWEDAT